MFLFHSFAKCNIIVKIPCDTSQGPRTHKPLCATCENSLLTSYQIPDALDAFVLLAVLSWRGINVFHFLA